MKLSESIKNHFRRKKLLQLHSDVEAAYREKELYEDQRNEMASGLWYARLREPMELTTRKMRGHIADSIDSLENKVKELEKQLKVLKRANNKRSKK